MYQIHKLFLMRNAGLSGIRSVRYRNEQKYHCRNQYGTEIKVPAPDSHAGCRNADANGIGFDAVARLWGIPNLIKDDLNLHLVVDDWPDLVAVEGEGLQVGQTAKHRSVHLHQLVLCQDAATNYNYNITKLLQQITITNYKITNFVKIAESLQVAPSRDPNFLIYVARFQPGWCNK
jgi:hypothetical protein